MSAYTTVQGDMWDAIAKKTLGSTDFTGSIMRLNPSLLGYYRFPSGVVLTIPDAADAQEDTSALPPWKQVSG